MKTYQDLVALGKDESARMDFILKVIADHKGSLLYKIACDADMYYRHLNPTIMRAMKIMYDLTGKAVPDPVSANNKIPCRFYFYFVTQLVQFLLGNGISFSEQSTVDKLGDKFDKAVQEAATKALNAGVSFGFWNVDHLEVFGVSDAGGDPAFVPLNDEENGALRAGVRFWQVDPDKPLRATLYEEDGFTEYIRRKGEDITVLRKKRDYIQIVEKSDAGGEKIYNGGNYPSFPIVPLFNTNKQSELIGSREVLDAYDLMASALINNVDDGNLIYWIIKNANGMDDMDDVKFVQRLKTMRVAHVDGDGGADVDSHSVEAPFQANEAALELLRKQLFDDFMALDVKEIAGGAATATQIKAAYEPLNSKADLFEIQVTDFLDNILALIGIDDEPTYTRSMIVNQQEMIQTILMAAQYLPDEYITKKLLEVLGDIDKVEDVLKQMDMENNERMKFGNAPEEEEQEEQPEEQEG